MPSESAFSLPPQRLAQGILPFRAGSRPPPLPSRKAAGGVYLFITESIRPIYPFQCHPYQIDALFCVEETSRNFAHSILCLVKLPEFLV